MNYTYCIILCTMLMYVHTQPMHKKNESFQVAYGAACNKGKRASMEDCYTLKSITIGKDPFVYAAVFDGHGGDSVARYLQENLHTELCNKTSKTTRTRSKRDLLAATFKAVNKTVPQTKNILTGSTATVALVDNYYIYLAHVGDSRAVDSNGKSLTPDHKPLNAKELERIGATKFFYNNGLRLGGVLAITRAFGDKDLQSLGLTAEPETKKIPTKNMDFVIIASDGLWDLIDNKIAAEFVRKKLSRGITPTRTAKELLIYASMNDHRLSDLDLHACSEKDLENTDLFYNLTTVRDNQTVIILQLKDITIKK